jgi:hypothetical protein
VVTGFGTKLYQCAMGPPGAAFYSPRQNKRSGRVMRASFDQKLTAASAFLIVCSTAACIVGATNAPSAAARSAPAQIADVNHANKGDQLTGIPAAMPVLQTQQKPSPPADRMKTSLQHPPVGCDPAFSPVADPALASIYKRCTV